MLAALLRHCESYSPPIAPFRRLVAWAFTDLAAAAAQPPLFALLKAILERKLVVIVEVYDVMLRVQVRICRSRTGNASMLF